MCCCAKPTINGEAGYRWQPTDTPSIREVYPPTLQECDQLLYDEPGRCGGIDGHSYHFRLVKCRSYLYLLVRHGGGEERIDLGCVAILAFDNLSTIDSTTRFWLLYSLYSVHYESRKRGRQEEATNWRLAAVDKRIRVRKLRGRDAFEVKIVAPTPEGISLT